MLGWVQTSKNALETSLRGQTRQFSLRGLGFVRTKYAESPNGIHARNIKSSPLLVYIDLLALF